jgi:acetoin utilization deacetylase AcuC-like enzyme
MPEKRQAFTLLLTRPSLKYKRLQKRLHIAYHPIYAHPLPEGHRFPMLKYELIPGQLLYEGTIEPHDLFAPEPCADTTILKTHTAEYLYKLKNGMLTAAEQRRIGFPQSQQLILRELMITQGTIDCCHHALKNGVALNVAGGTHHAFADRGEGFCLLNDFAVAANCLLDSNLAKQILIIDLDVHQGNGTAVLFQNKPEVFTFSMHGRQAYPFRKERSDKDIELEDRTDDATYMGILKSTLLPLLDAVQPDFAFYLAGVDVLQSDRFGKLALTLEGCKQRDAYVFSTLKQNGIPCTVAMGGGYSPDVKLIVEAHCNTFRMAKEVFELY